MPCVVWLATLVLAVEPPIQNQPREFTGAVGSFRAELEASAEKVEVDRPFTLTVRITARPGKALHKAPGRPNLRLIDSFAESFHIENTGPPVREADEGTWEFDYLLRPRSLDVTEVPELPFYYFDPAVDLNRYQKTFAEGLPLTVTAAKEEGIEAPAVPLPAGPESIYATASPAKVLRRTAEGVMPPWWLIVAGLVMPPLSCVAAWVAWRRLYPDAARRAHLRRSQAAERALKQLDQTANLPAAEQARRLERSLTGYLHRRFDLEVAAPTPAEAMLHLGAVGVSLEAMARVRSTYEACAAVEFGAGTANDLGRRVRELIVELEDEACRPRSCS